MFLTYGMQNGSEGTVLEIALRKCTQRALIFAFENIFFLSSNSSRIYRREAIFGYNFLSRVVSEFFISLFLPFPIIFSSSVQNDSYGIFDTAIHFFTSRIIGEQRRVDRRSPVTYTVLRYDNRFSSPLPHPHSTPVTSYA